MSGILTERQAIETEYQVVAPAPAAATPPPLPPAALSPIRRIELDGEHAGKWFEVERDIPFGLFLKVTSIQADAKSDEATAVKAFNELAQLLPEILVAWNFTTRRGEPIPCTSAGLLQVPVGLLQYLFLALNGGVEATPKS